jgi:hypothetical protein
MRRIFVIFIALLIGGCAAGFYGTQTGTSYQYSYAITKPETPNMNWSDDKIDIAFQISKTSIGFSLKNNTEDVMKVIWDEASIVQFGEAKKVMHSGVKYIDRNNSQPPSSIPPGASIEDLVLPTDNVYYREGYYEGGWEEYDLFATQDFNKPDLGTSILGMKGQKFSLYLPVQYKGQTVGYNFEFTITDVQPIQKKQM